MGLIHSSVVAMLLLRPLWCSTGSPATYTGHRPIFPLSMHMLVHEASRVVFPQHQPIVLPP